MCFGAYASQYATGINVAADHGVWSAYRGRVTQGKLDVAALRTLTGQVEAQLAAFTENGFMVMFADVTHL